MHEIDLPNFYYECESKSRVLYYVLVYSMLDPDFKLFGNPPAIWLYVFFLRSWFLHLFGTNCFTVQSGTCNALHPKKWHGHEY